MLKIEFPRAESTHLCKASLEGKWIVFTCPHCANYLRKMHRETGEMVVEKPGDPNILHQGVYVQDNLQNFESSLS